MNYKKYISMAMVLLTLVVISCRDESLYPLPYDDREAGHFLRIIKVTSNNLDFNDLANSAFEVVFESVDEEKGALLEEVEFYATHRNGATGLITNEVLVKTVAASDMGFDFVPQPTYSEYLRSEPIRVTATEIQAALAPLTADPDGLPGSCTNPKFICPAVAYPGALANNDQIVLRWKTRLKDGRTFTVPNPQAVVAPALSNGAEANMTPNITTGQFFNAPYIQTLIVRRTTNNAGGAGNPNAYTGTYRMTQVAVWSVNHNQELHLEMPNYLLKPFLFGNSDTDSTQNVTLSIPAGALPSEREFVCKYRGEDITVRINLEAQTNAGLTGAAGTAALNTLGFSTATDVPTFGGTPGKGLGFPAGTTNANLGHVFVPLLNSNVSCTSERELFLTTPVGGTFNGPITTHPVSGATISPSAPLALPWGAPRSTFPNRGMYRTDRDGLTPGDVFSIAFDDDADEYGRRNGYCTWTRRVYVTLTKLP